MIYYQGYSSYFRICRFVRSPEMLKGRLCASATIAVGPIARQGRLSGLAAYCHCIAYYNVIQKQG